jgi:hypothetical protein
MIMGVVIIVGASKAGLLTEGTVMGTELGTNVTLRGRPVVAGSGRHEWGKGSGWGGKRER